MEKTTVLARLRLTIAFTEEAVVWLNGLGENDWRHEENGSSFLSEYGSKWRQIFEKVITPEIRNYFIELGIPENRLPFVQLGESYRGSWIMDAVVVMAGTAGAVYATLKGVSELPEVADGLGDLKSRISKKLKKEVNEEVHDTLAESVDHNSNYQVENDAPELLDNDVSSLEENNEPTKSVSFLPAQPVSVDFMIDARPLRALTPSDLKSHKIHLSVAVSRDSFVLENLGHNALEDVQIGLFKTNKERNQWAFQDAYKGSVLLLSANQTITKELSDFTHDGRAVFNLSDGQQVYVDCWIQDKHGIYLFRFFLEAES